MLVTNNAGATAVDSLGEAACAAIEILIWQLVSSGVIRAAPLARELDRYAGFHGDAAPALRTLAHVTRAASFPDLVFSQHEASHRHQRAMHD
jgi:hypothetical protein